MSDASITVDFLQTLNVRQYFSLEITLYFMRIFDHPAQTIDIIVRQILDARIRIDGELREHLP